ncbi:helix-turn-helix domain-containing protein [Pseudomonas sp. ZM23]|uniref:Helix-turn-helix domain-containing protein n=1 Tax=Pseudomonas triclosanedens TaxID=2961893 RepID=A0ABY6ZS54_9PSED|nr:helix-turn-helix domain-containing protein [Pseudomonas triclosanedens]MCP8467199.1 helix-turn-helix domain-containing protein [Pseudomonas triclosanedens]MCP8472526.1 helix-turn-helix domain-containing protein [Pseudomonas triclosanedens]WAI47764.1 helix-turn-helix domain-containing protein [Pseudomonas triclosanedens]
MTIVRRIEDIVVDAKTNTVLAVVPEFKPKPGTVSSIITEYEENGYRRTFSVDAEAYPDGVGAPIDNVVELTPRRTNVRAIISNPVSRYFDHVTLADFDPVTLKNNEVPRWLDDIIRGAITTGPGTNNGKENVSVGDVIKVLRLPTISTTVASEILYNHDFERMSPRQVERVIQAARLALGGVVHYLRSHPGYLADAGLSVDLMSYSVPTAEQKKADALRMFDEGTKKAEICRTVSVTKPTLDAWIKQRKVTNAETG